MIETSDDMRHQIRAKIKSMREREEDSDNVSDWLEDDSEWSEDDSEQSDDDSEWSNDDEFDGDDLDDEIDYEDDDLTLYNLCTNIDACNI